MSEELNKELETEVTEEVKEAAPVETMEDFAAELEASYKTLNKRNIELSEEEPETHQDCRGGERRGGEMGPVRSDDGGQDRCQG